MCTPCPSSLYRSNASPTDAWQVMQSSSLAIPGGPESLTPYGLPTQQDEGRLGGLSWITQVLAGAQERYKSSRVPSRLKRPA
ncbi:hypothetical protein SAMN00790413_03617 [Deinococcus hopiensis KR-140]|uniref:Uncharacterized protein n=1 Tax=Deinococcus hopiensis KR-140 TaxID=695939 RepID=A0A1W1UYB3_9DEIO|nr:hypothetical protein SAMN00790413_03617 [Deinococcus hopiensis KR-140]